jgi:hypothetical protein
MPSRTARKGELVVTLADRVPDDIKYVQEIRDASARRTATRERGEK